jgi:extradiol dioxygenase family protein
MEPFLHLSVPVSELDASLTFYVDTLGCAPGRVRREQGFADVWFYGMQLTLQEQPDHVLPAALQGARHFGAALPADELADVFARLDRASVEWLERPTVDTDGRLNGKTSAKFADPSGNVIELKSYPGGRADITGE